MMLEKFESLYIVPNTYRQKITMHQTAIGFSLSFVKKLEKLLKFSSQSAIKKITKTSSRKVEIGREKPRMEMIKTAIMLIFLFEIKLRKILSVFLLRHTQFFK